MDRLLSIKQIMSRSCWRDSS